MKKRTQRRSTKRLRLRRKLRRTYRQRGGAGSTELLRGYPMLVTAKPPGGDADDPDRIPTVMRSTTFLEESDGNPEQPATTA